MFGKKQSKGEVAVGIDVGNFAVKVLQISRLNDTVTLERFGYSKVNPNKIDGTVEAVKNACLDAQLDYKKVNSAISAEGAIVRYLMMPAMNQDDLAKAMEFEIERYVPFERKEVVSDYLIIKEKSDSRNLKILLVAAKKDFIENRVKVLKDAGLDPEILTIDSLVLKNSFHVNYPDRKDKTIGLLNIGSKISNINIIRNNTSYFMRDVQLGGDSLTHLLKEKLEVDFVQAEDIKCTISPDDKEKLKIIEPVLGNLLNEVYLSFDYYESELGIAVEEVFISGGTALLTRLTNFLKENLNREVSILNAVNQVRIAPSIAREKIDPHASSLVVPLGLALESFN